MVKLKIIPLSVIDYFFIQKKKDTERKNEEKENTIYS